MLGTSSGNGGGGGEALHTSIMTGIGDDEKSQSGGGGGGDGGDLFENDRSTGGNRWPRQETLALLKIRSDMDVTFRDSSLKGPLWEEISRKMGELGYHRSAKKCKEKFENVYKYHKRTKDGRVGKSDGKTYRFFDQLQALEQHHFSITTSSNLPPLPQPTAQVTPRVQSQAPPEEAVPVTMVIPAGNIPASVTVSSSSPHPISVVHTTSMSTTPQQQINVNRANHAVQLHTHQNQHQHHVIPTQGSIQMENASSPSATQSSSSSTSSDEELLGRRKRKRKWKDYFEKLMKEVIDKQEQLQKRFLEAVEKRELDRVAREDAWKLQEMERLNREHEILVQERAEAAAKDAALIAFLQKLSDQPQISVPLPVQVQVQAQAQAQDRGTTPLVASSIPTTPQPQPQPQPQINVVVENPLPLPSQPPPQPKTQPPPQPKTQPPPQPQPVTPMPVQTPPHLQQAIMVVNTNNGDNVDLERANNGDNLLQPSSSRWPKAEIEALINLRTSLDQKYQDNGPKGPLWEEISSLMKKIGYNRNAKRCKEKWENINKYYKKVKESNKKRPEDSKTCPYFHQLDALYREKNKMEITSPSFSSPTQNPAPMPVYGQPQIMKHEGTSMASQPEQQQWPTIHMHPEQTMEDQGSENLDESEEDGDEDEDDEDQSGYEIVPNHNNGNAS